MGDDASEVPSSIVSWTDAAAKLCMWVYDDVTGQSIAFQNCTDETLAIYIEETGEEIRLEPGGSSDVLQTQADAVQVRINRLGLLGLASWYWGEYFDLTRWYTRLATLSIRAARRYCIYHTIEGAAKCEVQNPLPEGMQIKHLRKIGDGNLVQWAVATSEDTIYVTFKGTSDAIDVIINGGFITHDDAPHCLRVHGGMWNALHQTRENSRHHTFEKVRKVIRGHRRRHQGLKNVVLCGHSLGGGYAILVALEMLYNDLDVTAVLTFGAPQVIVPERENPLWQRLNAITSLFINAYDAFPRVPSCLNWVFDTIPKALKAKELKWSCGGLYVSIDTSEKLEKALGHHRKAAADYDTVGTLSFICSGSRSTRRVASTDDQHWNVLSALPEPVGPFVLEQHSMSNYVQLIAGLAD